MRDGFPDMAFFHVCHAYECVLCALIAAKGAPVPPEGQVQLVPGQRGFRLPSGGTETGVHNARRMLFDHYADRTKPYFSIHMRLKRLLTMDARNTSLYYDTRLDRLPHQAYRLRDAQAAYKEVRRFAGDVWATIR